MFFFRVAGQHRALGRGKAGRDLDSTQHAFSPSSPIQFSLVLSLSVAHRCFDDSLCDVMFPYRVSPRNPKGSAHGSISSQLPGNVSMSALSLYCASLKNYLIFTFCFTCVHIN